MIRGAQHTHRFQQNAILKFDEKLKQYHRKCISAELGKCQRPFQQHGRQEIRA